MKNEQGFLDFQKYFTEYQKRFGLTGYKVYFKHEPIDAFADITFDIPSMVVTVRLNSKTSNKDKLLRTAKESAKHEALHLLVSKIEDLAYARFINEKQIWEATEEVVFKLEGLVED